MVITQLSSVLFLVFLVNLLRTSCMAFPILSILFNYYFRFTEFGGPVPYRPAEDLAFSVARFIQTGGSFINYYMVCDRLL